MKKIKHLLVLVAALAPLSLAAQTGLAVNRVFQGLVVPQKQMVEERKKGRNASTILTLPQRGKTNRFLCYLTKQKGRAVVTTLAYMEGSVSNIDELRRLIE